MFDRVKPPVEPGAYASLSVSDTGKGIAPEHMPHIFEPFYTTKEVGVGTGLGLATVEGVVAQSGGRIQVESELNRGTTITVLLPLTSEPMMQPASRQRVFRPSTVAGTDSGGGGRGHGTCHRDAHAAGRGLRGARRPEGNEALRELEEIGGAVNLVMTDIVMPGMGGRQLATELSRSYRRIPIVWMSGHARDTELQLGQVGRDEPFLHKPIYPSCCWRRWPR